MNLPYADELLVSKLATSFGNTSATFTFYWLFALLELVEEGQVTLPKRQLFARMICNLVSIDKRFISTKSDMLPRMETHFDGFFKLQKQAFEIIHYHNPKSKLLDEFLIIYPELSNSNSFDYIKYKESIQPFVTMAHNNGFGYLV